MTELDNKTPSVVVPSGRTQPAGVVRVLQRALMVYGVVPNLQDEGDNHLVELAVAGGASRIVTHNLRDLRDMELKFPDIAAVTPAQLLKERGP